MTGAWHGGKGSDPRPEAEQGAFARGFDKIDWTKRGREAGCPLCGATGLHACTGAPRKPLTERDKQRLRAAMVEIDRQEREET